MTEALFKKRREAEVLEDKNSGSKNFLGVDPRYQEVIKEESFTVL